MVYLDTNILIYASIQQDEKKQKNSIALIEKLVENNELILSPLVLQEFIFTLSKLKIDSNIINNDMQFYLNFTTQNYTKTMLEEALEICIKDRNCKNINDILHTKLATKYATKLITYDNDFKKLQKHTDIIIEIL